MNVPVKPLTITGIGAAAAVAIVAAMPVAPVGRDLAIGPVPSVSSSVALLSQSQALATGGNAGNVIGDISAVVQFITNVLNNNQALVLDFATHVPAQSIGPIKVGGALLADAYYDGYAGSATGLPGVIAYVTSQLVAGLPAGTIKSIILDVTGQIPKFSVGPVHVGGALLANSYFDGYNGSATGLPGVIAYVRSQLGIKTPSAGAAVLASHAARVAVAPAASLPVATAATIVVSATTTKAATASSTSSASAKSHATTRGAASTRRSK